MQHTTRVSAIDVAKGIGIICIVLGHVLPHSFVYSLLYAFHVPLFFVLSGLTYHHAENLRGFLVDKIRRILVPYASFALISIVLYRLMPLILNTPVEEARLLPNILGMLYANTNTGWMAWNRPLWFLPCLFAVLVLVHLAETLLRRLPAKRRQLLRGCIVAAALALGAWLNKIPGLYLPFQLESAVLLTAFAELGVILREGGLVNLMKSAQSLRRWRAFAWAVPLAVIALLISRYNGHVDIRAHMLGRSAPLMFLASCGFIAVVLGLSVCFSCCGILQRLGRSSLSILLMHKFPILFFQMVLPLTRRLLSSWDTLAGFLCGLAVTALTLLLCLLAEKLLVLLCPAVLGKRKN